MIRRIFFPLLLETGPVDDRLLAVRDGFVNFYLVKGPEGLVCFDTGWSPAGVARGFATLGLAPEGVKALFLTHGHWDHARCLRLFPNAEVFVGEGEAVHALLRGPRPASPLRTVGDGQRVAAAGLSVRAVATPGHTPGSVCYLVEGRYLFVGDALRLRRGEVRPFYVWFNRDGKTLRRSIAKLARIDGVECLLTAHTGMTRDPACAFSRWRGPLHQGGNRT